MQESGEPWCGQSGPMQHGGRRDRLQNIPLSGGAFNKLLVFLEFVAEVAFVKVTKNNNLV